MSDITANSLSQPQDWNSEQAQKRVRRRYRHDKIIQGLGLGAIALAILMLGILIASLISNGYKAFVQSKVTVQVTLDQSDFNPEEPARGNYRAAVRDCFRQLLPGGDVPAGSSQSFRHYQPSGAICAS